MSFSLNNSSDQEQHYKLKLNKSLDKLKPELQSSFRKALIPHEFNLEIFIPKSMKINPVHFQINIKMLLKIKIVLDLNI